jgi:TIR domain/Pentapeptide repeats (8 copies)
MANEEHVAILEQGVEVWNKWRKDNPRVRPDFGGADLRGAALSEADLSAANLYKANLSGADLSRANLRGATLREIDLSSATLSGADLSEAALSDADLSGAILYHADLRVANLYNADLSGSTLDGADLAGAILYHANLRVVNLSRADLGGAKMLATIITNVDLSGVKGLESVIHGGPSEISISTIYQSKGNIPEVFLRGCGVPENFIVYMHSLAGQPKAFEFYSCFISHSAKDKPFCERVYTDLQGSGVRTWYFPEDAKWGESVWGEIDRSIRIYDKLVVVCSKNSLHSGPVLREIERALNREDKEGKSILFPITLDDCIFEEWENARKADVLRKVVGDFRGWEKSASKYDAAFKKLLRGLKAEEGKGA